LSSLACIKFISMRCRRLDPVTETPLTKFQCARICGAMMIAARIPLFRRRRRFAAGDRV
jgi:hypothetical protein